MIVRDQKKATPGTCPAHRSRRSKRSNHFLNLSYYFRHLTQRRSSRKVSTLNSSSAHAKMEALAPYLPPALLPLVEQTMEQLRTQCHTLGIAALSLAAVLLSYLFIAGSREAPVTFTVPHPPEIEDNWTGTKWEDLPKGSQERRVTEGQISGVSFVCGCASSKFSASISNTLSSWLGVMLMWFCPSNGTRT
jgi:hypothetical protein